MYHYLIDWLQSTDCLKMCHLGNSRGMWSKKSSKTILMRMKIGNNYHDYIFKHQYNTYDT